MTIQEFAELVHNDTVERFEKDYENYPPNMLEKATTVHIRPGKKYTKVDLDTSGKFMVVNDTGEIFGIKAYGVIHRGHYFGTLETTSDWFWGDYQPSRKPN